MGPLFCFILLIPLPATAGGKKIPQNLSSIYGKVTDSNKNRDKLLPGVKAYLFRDTLLIDSVIVKETGDYKFDNLREGTYDIVIRGNEYFPIKIVGTKVEKSDTLAMIQVEPKTVYILEEKFKADEILYRRMYVYFKPVISESDIEDRIEKDYGYKLQVFASEFQGTRKVIRLKDVLSCTILLPEGETLINAVNKIIMDPFVNEVVPPIAIKIAPIKILERKYNK